MGTRSLVSGAQSKASSDRRMGFGQLDVKKEFRIKKETPEDEIKEYAETAMNELLGWYGYDKLDSRDTQGLDLHHFAANKASSTGHPPDDPDSEEGEPPKTVPSPKRRDASGRESPPPTAPQPHSQNEELLTLLAAASPLPLDRPLPPRQAVIQPRHAATWPSFLALSSPPRPEQGADPAGCIVCSWCNKVVSHKMFSLKTPGGEKSFCSEMCFSQCRRANFKRNKTCDWCRHIRHTVNYVDFQDGEHQLQFCSDKCLNQYKMNIFCKETEAHLQLHPHLQGLGSSGGTGNGNASVRLITPELWLRDCRSESPFSDRSASPADNSSPIEIKVVMRPPNEGPHLPLKPTPSALEINKPDKKSRKNNHLLAKTKRHPRSFLPPGDRRASSSPRSTDTRTPPKPVFPPPLLPLNGTHISPIAPNPNLPPDPALLRPPFLPLNCFPPPPILPPNHPAHRNPHPYTHLLRPSLISPPSPSAPPLPPTPAPAPNPNPPPRTHLPPPPRSLLPPVTVLVPYPIALAIPIPLPIPIPIPLLPPPKKTPDPSPPTPTPDHLLDPPPPPASPEPSVPRPLRKRKRATEVPPPEEDAITKRKTVPV